MDKFNTISEDINDRFDEIINIGWKVFVSHYVNNKYEVNTEAPFQLHFSTILKKIGEIYCIKQEELFRTNLEVDMGEDSSKNYIDIVISIFDKRRDREFFVPIELKYKKKSNKAENIAARHIYKDISFLENLYFKKDSNIPSCYFIMITDNNRYVEESRSGMRNEFSTFDGAVIEKEHEYKYLDTKTGRNFYNKYGGTTFQYSHIFDWKEYILPDESKEWFLKMKIGN